MSRLTLQVENSKQLEPLPRMAAMTQDRNDQHLAARQNGLNQSEWNWSLEVSNTAMWSGAGVFVILVVAFISMLIKKKNKEFVNEYVHNDRREEDKFIA